MPFDPTKPEDDSPLVSAEMRGQLTALRDLIAGLEARVAALEGPMPVPGAPQNFTLQSGAPGSGEVIGNGEPPPEGDHVTEVRLYNGSALVASGPAFPLVVGGFTTGETVNLVARYVNTGGESGPSDVGSAAAG